MAGDEIDVDIETAPEEHLPGFTDFAEFIASDYSLSVYRKFSVLGTRNILYLQAELQLLELQLKALDKEDQSVLDSGADDEKLRTENAARSWEELKAQAKEGDEIQASKLELILSIRKIMKEYEEALLRRNQVLSLEEPAQGPFQAFKAYFRRTPPMLWGSGFHLLDKEDDMIALGSQAEPDRMSALMHRCLGYRLRNQRNTPKSWGPMYYYPVERVNLVVGIISIIASAALLVGAITALNFVKTRGIRLGLVGVFTVMFATSITLLTRCRRIEVYGATAAYAAVLVVFVSVNN